MATLKSIFRYTGTGVAQILNVPPYISKTHISVYVDGAVDSGFSWLTASTIQLTAPVGATVVVQRKTSHNERVVDYNGSVPLTEADLDLDSLHAFYMGQEARDVYDDLVGLSDAPLEDALTAAVQANSSAGQAALARDNAQAAQAVAEGLMNGSGDTLISRTAGASGDAWFRKRTLGGYFPVGSDVDDGFSPRGELRDYHLVDATTDADFFVGEQIRMRTDGAASTGGREASLVALWHMAPTAASNVNRNYVSQQLATYVEAGDGGTDTALGALGAFFGGGDAIYVNAGATNLYDVCAKEFNVFASPSSTKRSQKGIAITGCNGSRGTSVDAMISFGAQPTQGPYGPHIGWKYGLCFNDQHGAAPFASDSILMGSAFVGGRQAIEGGLDLFAFDMSAYVIRGRYFKATETGITSGDSGGFAILGVDGPSADAGWLLRSKGTGSTYVQNGDGTVTSLRLDSNGAVLMPSLTVSAGAPVGAPSGLIYADSADGNRLKRVA